MCPSEPVFPSSREEDYVSQPSSTPLHLGMNPWVVLSLQWNVSRDDRPATSVPPAGSLSIYLLKAKDFKDPSKEWKESWCLRHHAECFNLLVHLIFITLGSAFFVIFKSLILSVFNNSFVEILSRYYTLLKYTT